MFRCPTCVAVLSDSEARRCPMCGTNLRRHRPEVLGQSARVTAKLQPIDLRLPRLRHPALAGVDIDLTAAEAVEAAESEGAVEAVEVADATDAVEAVEVATRDDA